MKLELFQNNSSNNTINKNLIPLDILEIHLKQGINLVHTQVIIHNSDKLNKLNYAKMLNRYYFVQVSTLTDNNFLLLNLNEDVLETYKQDILNSSQDVVAKSQAGNVSQSNISNSTISKVYNSDTIIPDGSTIVIETSGESFYNKEDKNNGWCITKTFYR